MDKSVMKHFVIILILISISGLAIGCGGFRSGSKSALRRGSSEQWSDLLDGELPQKLQEIREHIVKGKNRKAYKQAKKWIKKNPDSPFMDRGLFLQGRAQFERKLYYQSFVILEDLLDQHAGSELFEPALRQEMEIARLFLGGAKRKVWGFIPSSARTEAVAILESIEDRWPGSELAATALMMKADYYFNKGDYLEAQYAYQVIIDNYKNRSVYEPALLRCAKATHGQYLGGPYDTHCLVDAMIRYKQYELSFPAGARQANIDREIETIREQQTNKEFEIADFYRRTNKLQAARYYWSSISSRWPNTIWSRQAQQQLKEYQ